MLCCSYNEVIIFLNAIQVFFFFKVRIIIYARYLSIDLTKRVFYPFSVINDVVEFFDLLKTQHRLKSSFALKKYSIYFDAKLDFKSAYFKSAKTESINIDSTKRAFYPFSFINDVVEFFALLKTQHRLKSSFCFIRLASSMT
ncbi:hypothetical protein IX38_22015 [Chryseobacterium luteum]|uniref:Uncharacterized protein n=1 Tax=Chryseobacterium luteum TaxID=421531 RepID=A0A085YXX5_9FLAO|nr:hypothetical protein IX38_22015 [Chryseobacterium luteum]